MKRPYVRITDRGGEAHYETLANVVRAAGAQALEAGEDVSVWRDNRFGCLVVGADGAVVLKISRGNIHEADWRADAKRSGVEISGVER